MSDVTALYMSCNLLRNCIVLGIISSSCLLLQCLDTMLQQHRQPVLYATASRGICVPPSTPPKRQYKSPAALPINDSKRV